MTKKTLIMVVPLNLAANKEMIPRRDYDDYSKFVNDTQTNKRYVDPISLIRNLYD